MHVYCISNKNYNLYKYITYNTSENCIVVYYNNYWGGTLRL